MSSTYTELEAISMALQYCPENTIMKIFCDSSSSISLVNNLLKGYPLKPGPNFLPLEKIKKCLDEMSFSPSIIKVKAHSGLLGNEIANTFAQISTSLPYDEYDFIFCDNFGSPTLGRKYKNVIRTYYPQSEREINNKLSFQWIFSTHHKSTVFFKWATGIIYQKPFLHYTMQKKLLCSKCNTLHALTLFDTLAFCPSTENLRKNFFDLWTIDIKPHFELLTPHDKKRFLRGIIPNSLEQNLLSHNHNIKKLIHERNVNILSTILYTLKELSIIFLTPKTNLKRKRVTDD